MATTVKVKVTRTASSLAIVAKQVPDNRVFQFLRTRVAVKSWIENVLSIQGKLEDDLFKSLGSGVRQIF
jgi:hypothetical protein